MPQIKEMAEITFSVAELTEMVTQAIMAKSPGAEGIEVRFGVDEEEGVEDGQDCIFYALNTCVVTIRGAVEEHTWAAPKKTVKKVNGTAKRVVSPAK